MKTKRIKYYVLGEECGNITSYGYYNTAKDANNEAVRLTNFFKKYKHKFLNIPIFYVKPSNCEPFQVNV
jgi:hypothetical protein